jgi:hypothetical protein
MKGTCNYTCQAIANAGGKYPNAINFVPTSFKPSYAAGWQACLSSAQQFAQSLLAAITAEVRLMQTSQPEISQIVLFV